ncbi:MAG: hypothetical protein O3A00_14865 [Planctomycetota bacterium]|nr:hypothetical protein [Planctomycetota bacterium]
MSTPAGNQRPQFNWVRTSAACLRYAQRNTLVVASIVLLAISAVFYVKAEAHRAALNRAETNQTGDTPEGSE